MTPQDASEQRREEIDYRSIEILGGGRTNIEDYENLKAVGKGKFSVVYKANLKSNGTRVAMKRIPLGEQANNTTLNRCLKEVRLIQSVEHPNIVQYQDAFMEPNELIIVLEWASAGDLKRQIRKAREANKRFDERVIWKYFIQISRAMQHMHQKRIIHRDLKPANIFLMTNGMVKVGDLGLGRFLEENTRHAFTKVGTPLYMAPEVIKSSGYDFKSDIWSLGCILYEFAQLHSPFKQPGIALVDLFKNITGGQYPPLDNTYSKALQNLTTSMLNLDPEKRPDIDKIVRDSEAAYAAIPPAGLKNQIQRPHPERAQTPPVTEAARTGSPEQQQQQPPPLVESPVPSPVDVQQVQNEIHTPPPPGAAFQVMEDVYDMWLILNLNQRVPSITIDRHYFALEHPKGATYQFHKFLKVVLCLFEMLHAPLKIAKSQTTNVCVQIVYEHTKSLIKKRKAKHDLDIITASNLIPGYGFDVCIIIRVLCQRIVQKQAYLAMPQYGEDSSRIVKEEEMHSSHNPDGGSWDAEEVPSDEEDSQGVIRASAKLVTTADNNDELLQNPTEPEEWAKELEHAQPRLESFKLSTHGWRSRLSKMKIYLHHTRTLNDREILSLSNIRVENSLETKPIPVTEHAKLSSRKTPKSVTIAPQEPKQHTVVVAEDLAKPLLAQQTAEEPQQVHDDATKIYDTMQLKLRDCLRDSRVQPDHLQRVPSESILKVPTPQTKKIIE